MSRAEDKAQYLRMIQDLSQKSGGHGALARALVGIGATSVTATTVARWCRGKTTPNVAHAEHLDRIVGVSISPSFAEICGVLRSKDKGREPEAIVVHDPSPKMESRSWGAIAIGDETWKIVPSPDGVKSHTTDASSKTWSIPLSSTGATLSLSSDGRSAAQLFEGVLQLAWVNRLVPKLLPWPREIDLDLEPESRLLSVSMIGAERLQCVVSSPTKTYLVVVGQLEPPLIKMLFEEPSRAAAYLEGQVHTVDPIGVSRTRWLRNAFPELTTIGSLDVSVSPIRSVVAAIGCAVNGSTKLGVKISNAQVAWQSLSDKTIHVAIVRQLAHLQPTETVITSTESEAIRHEFVVTGPEIHVDGLR